MVLQRFPYSPGFGLKAYSKTRIELTFPTPTTKLPSPINVRTKHVVISKKKLASKFPFFYVCLFRRYGNSRTTLPHSHSVLSVSSSLSITLTQIASQQGQNEGTLSISACKVHAVPLENNSNSKHKRQTEKKCNTTYNSSHTLRGETDLQK